MKNRIYFIILTAIVLGILGLSIFLASIMEFHKGFVVLAALSIALIVVLIIFSAQVLKPLNTISDGINLLKSRDFNSKLVHVGEKQTDEIIELFNLMMSQLKEERLKVMEQNNLLNLLFNSSPMGIVILDINNKISSINSFASRLLNTNKKIDLEQKSLEKLDGELIKSLLNLKKNESETIKTSDSNIYKCTHAYFIKSGAEQSYYLIEPLTDEIFKEQKATYNKIVRIISHEVNNSMAGISSTISIIKDCMNESTHNHPKQASNEQQELGSLIEMLDIISERSLNLSSFIKNFSDVARVPEAQMKDIALAQYIKSRMPFFESISAGKNIKFIFEEGDFTGTVAIDPLMMEQALLNIVKNAVEAITVSGTNADFQKQGTIQINLSNSPFYICISDNGSGISEEASKNIFSPFYSTKPNGQGLGLMLVKELLYKQGFKCSLSSEAEGITRFNIFY